MLRGTFQPDSLTGERHFRWRGGAVSRLEALSDAIFALALTLLVVRLEVPTSYTEVEAALLHAPVYVACFAVFLWIWYCHFQFHRRYGLEGPLTVALDGALLFVVLLFALPLRFVAEQLFALAAGGGPADRPLALTAAEGRRLMTFYAGGFALVFGLLLTQTWRALRLADVLELDAVERAITRGTLGLHAASTAVGLTSLALVACDAPGPIAGYCFFALGPVHGVLGYLMGRRVERLADSDAAR